MYIGIHVKCLLFFSDFKEGSVSSIDLEKYSNIILHKNPSSESRVVPCGQTDGEADVSKMAIEGSQQRRVGVCNSGGQGSA
jgi:hypothetical protein